MSNINTIIVKVEVVINLYLFWIAHVTNFYNIMQSYNLKLYILCSSPK